MPLLFTENETNNERLFPGQPNDSPYVKDGINDCVVEGQQEAVNPGKEGTKVAAHYRLNVAPGQSAADSPAADARFAESRKGAPCPFGRSLTKTWPPGCSEADEFYAP